MTEILAYSITEGLESSSVILNVPSKHQGRRTRFSLTEKYRNEHGAPIMVAQATVISRHPVAKTAHELDAEIGDIVNWVSSDKKMTRWQIVDDRPMNNPYLAPVAEGEGEADNES